MFAGNIGEGQDIRNLFKAIKLVLKNNSKIRFLFVGDGRMSNWLKIKVSKYNLENNVIFYGSHPVMKMPEVFILKLM